MAKNKTYPDRTVEKALQEAGHGHLLFWEVPGPKDTGIAWVSCYGVKSTVIHVVTYKEGGWQVLTPCQSAEVDDTLADLFKRCGLPKYEPKKEVE